MIKFSSNFNFSSQHQNVFSLRLLSFHSKEKEIYYFPEKPNSNLVNIMTFWRAAGLTYINYSTIAARATREALKKGVDVRPNLDISVSNSFTFRSTLRSEPSLASSSRSGKTENPSGRRNNFSSFRSHDVETMLHLFGLTTHLFAFSKTLF